MVKAKVTDPCAAMAKLGLPIPFTANGQKFRAFAVANLDGDSDLDVWSIDEVKSLERVRRD